MKPTEVQIGDWVIPRIWDADSEPSKIVGIQYNSYRGKDYVDWVDCEVWDELDMDDIKPIPLTPEILKKSGYHTTPIYDIDDDSIVYQHIDLCGEWTWYNGKIYYSITDEEVVEMFDCKYVHELQHFLRLRGIEKEIVL